MRGHWSLVASALPRVDLPVPGWPLMRMMVGIGCLGRDEEGITRIKSDPRKIARENVGWGHLIDSIQHQ